MTAIRSQFVAFGHKGSRVVPGGDPLSHRSDVALFRRKAKHARTQKSPDALPDHRQWKFGLSRDKALKLFLGKWHLVLLNL